MCGRFVLNVNLESFAKQYEAVAVGELPAPSWNVAPTQSIAILLNGSDGIRRLAPAYWSLIPPWSETKSPKYPTFNARVETAAEKRTYAQAAKTQRALIVASGYYEWKGNQPYYFHRADNEPLLLAGLYSWWRKDSDSSWELTATILTRDSVGDLSQIHDRMPVLVSDNLISEWLDKTIFAEILPTASAEAGVMAANIRRHRVRPLRGDGPELIAKDEGDIHLAF